VDHPNHFHHGHRPKQLPEDDDKGEDDDKDKDNSEDDKDQTPPTIGTDQVAQANASGQTTLTLFQRRSDANKKPKDETKDDDDEDKDEKPPAMNDGEVS
jgi:hypothetical protein